MSDVDEIEIPPAFKRKYGDLCIPSNADMRAWTKGRLSASQSGQGLDLEGRPITPVPGISRWAHPVNPSTGRWTPPWKPLPTGEGIEANLRTRFKPGSAHAREAGRKGGRRRTKAKVEAARMNVRKRKRPDSS